MISYAELNRELVEALPELKDKYKEELDWWKDEIPGPHVVFGDLLVPAIISALDTEDRSFLKRAFSLLERMSESPDVKIQEVVAMSIMEGLIGRGSYLAFAKNHMGPKTASIADEMIIYWTARTRKN